jgi:two-component system, cell cycle response regulator DivK
MNRRIFNDRHREAKRHNKGVCMLKILLVEDNEMNRDMLSRRLRRKGFEVLLATDGADGISLARSSAPDLILMDMSLPTVDGWTAAKVLKGESDTRDIPIIALTAHAMQGDRDKAMESGCDEYETKPVNLARLLSKIETLTGSSMHP